MRKERLSGLLLLLVLPSSMAMTTVGMSLLKGGRQEGYEVLEQKVKKQVKEQVKKQVMKEQMYSSGDWGR